MRQPGEWMQMPTDDRILEVLETGLRFTPAVIAENIGKTREQVQRRVSELHDRGLVERPKRGYYEITEEGRAYLAGDLDAESLDLEEDG